MPRTSLQGRLRQRVADLPEPAPAQVVDATPAPRGPGPRPNGPLDAGEVDSVTGMFDLGAVFIPNLEGVTLQARLDDRGTPAELLLVAGTWRATVGVFAAPRSRALSAGVLAEVAASMTAAGAHVSSSTGPWGEQVDVLAPAHGTGRLTPVRVTACDGPGWFVRVVFQPHQDDPATPAVEPEQLGAHLDAALPPDGLLWSACRAAVVNRGPDPAAPGQPLPMNLAITAVTDTAQPAQVSRYATWPQ